MEYDNNNFILLDSISSTNDYLKKNYGSLSNFTVAVAKKQTSGKGRMGRQWLSGEGSLSMSVLIKESGLLRQDGISLICAISVCEALEKQYGINTDIKWPNDILLKGKKLSGILIENVFINGNCGCTIIGIGLNLNNEAFPGEIAHIATSLFIETGKRADLPEFAVILANILEKRLCHSQDKYNFVEEYTKKCISINKDICVLFNGSKLHGRALSVNGNGSLRIETEAGKQTDIFSGDVSIRTERGYV